MRKLLTTLVLSCLLSGCIITQYHGLHDIITENVVTYEQYEQVKFENVAAIMKSYSNLVNSKTYKSTSNLKKDKEKFINKLKTENISENYPVKASVQEVMVSKEFLDDVVGYAGKQERYQRCINEALRVYITELIHYEEKIP